jgi:MoaA/NifB/PqqE/SkfB family radical SAM enzyme
MKPPWTARDKRRWLRRAANRAALALGARLGLAHAPGRPRLLMIEPTNRCNLRCPLCPVGAGTLGRAPGQLPFALFERILSDLDGALERVLLYNYGEPFLHPQVFDMLAAARAAEIHTRVSTNGLVFDRAHAADELIECGLSHLRVSLDGATQETYATYRAGGRLEPIVAGVRLLQTRKRALGRARPVVELQFIAMRHNEHELPAMRALAHELGTPLRVKAVGLGDKVRDAEAGRWLPSAGALRRYDARDGSFALAGGTARACTQPWHRLVVNCDGQVVPCCYDRDGAYAFGNAADGLVAVWNGAPLQAFRRALRSPAPPVLCTRCAVNLWGSPRLARVEA